MGPFKEGELVLLRHDDGNESEAVVERATGATLVVRTCNEGEPPESYLLSQAGDYWVRPEEPSVHIDVLLRER